MVGEKDPKGSKQPKWLTQLFHEIAELHRRNHQIIDLQLEKIRLKENGVEMAWGDAQCIVGDLRTMQSDPSMADLFHALVGLVKPRHATMLHVNTSPSVLKRLEDGLVIGPNGSPDPDIAAVLDAAYVETEEGVALRDPVAYTPEFVKKWAGFDKRIEGEMNRICEEAKRSALRDRDGPSRR